MHVQTTLFLSTSTSALKVCLIDNWQLDCHWNTSIDNKLTAQTSSVGNPGASPKFNPLKPASDKRETDTTWQDWQTIISLPNVSRPAASTVCQLGCSKKNCGFLKFLNIMRLPMRPCICGQCCSCDRHRSFRKDGQTEWGGVCYRDDPLLKVIYGACKRNIYID